MLPALAPLALALTTALVTVPSTAVWPLQPPPEVVSRFDAPEQAWGSGHRGVDLLGWPGQPVHSALDGRVTFAGRVAGRGVVVVAHGGRRTTYEPVDPTVRAGDPVVAGQVIGELDWAGGHCPPRACLHWGLVEGRDDYRDPLVLLPCQPSPVRLLPLDRPAPHREDCAPVAPTLGEQLLEELIRLAGALAGTPGAVGQS